MVEYSCPRCGYTTQLLANYKTHIQRKTLCPSKIANISLNDILHDFETKTQKTDGYKCDFCDKSFKTRQGKHQHKIRCQGKTMICEIKNLQNEMDMLKEQMTLLSKTLNAPSTINNTSNTIIQNNIQINIKDFGRENISYIDKDDLTEWFINKDIVSLIENIHCDKEHPENHNLRVKSQKRKQIETRINDKWIIKDEDDALTECVQNGYRILVKHPYNHKNEILEDNLDDNEDEYHILRDWLESIFHNHNDVQKPIKRKILLLLLSNQALLLGKDCD